MQPLKRTPENFLRCINSLFGQMKQMAHDEVIICYSKVPPNNGSIRMPCDSFEQADFVKVTALLPTKEIKIRYRKNIDRFISFKVTEAEMEGFVSWLKGNIDELTPEQFSEHYSIIKLAVCSGEYGCDG